MDGMDQSKTDLPHFARKNKAACNMWVLRTHMHCRHSYAFLNLHTWPHDSNLSINILLKILLDLSKADGLPSTLHLQLDNCFRENKNQFVFGFLGLLVHKEIFKEVTPPPPPHPPNQRPESYSLIIILLWNTVPIAT